MPSLFRYLLLSPLLLLSLLSGCEQSADTVPSAETPEAFQNYTETGDLDAMQERGILRLLAPRFDDDAMLPSDGLPLHTYHEIAEQFAASLGLRPEWVLVDDFATLLDVLEQGAADLLVTNLTHTPSRAERVVFSVPLSEVDEVLVVPKRLQGKGLAELGELTVSVPAGTAWAESLAALSAQFPGIQGALVSGELSDANLLEGVASGRYQATALDEDVARVLVPSMTELAIGPVLHEDRDIGWAMRKNNPQLRRALNDYLISSRVVASRRQQERRDWKQIKNSGVLRVITGNNPASYFLWRGELMGFDYELMKAFADKHKLRISMVVRDGPEQMHEALEKGYGDVIAAAMTQTPTRQKRGWVFSRRYLTITEQFVGRADMAPMADLSELTGKTVVVNPEHSYFDTLQALQKSAAKFTLVPLEHASSEMLMAMVADGDFDLTLVDSHLAAMETTFRDDLKVVHDLAEEKQIGWVVRADQPDLLANLNTYIRKAYRGLHYNVVYQRYFSEPKSISRYREQRIEPGKALSPYDELVREHADRKDLDWRLLVAQMYQESRFDPKARSYAGAVGLMQMLPRTGKQFGYSDVRPPHKNVAASVDFIEWLGERFPDDLPIEERLYFTLAAYNAGHAHVQDARRLARQLGKDPDRWFGHVEKAMLLLSQPRYARQARFGYVRGSEPVNYVREIRERYVGYLDARVEKY